MLLKKAALEKLAIISLIYKLEKLMNIIKKVVLIIIRYLYRKIKY